MCVTIHPHSPCTLPPPKKNPTKPKQPKNPQPRKKKKKEIMPFRMEGKKLTLDFVFLRLKVWISCLVESYRPLG